MIPKLHRNILYLSLVFFISFISLESKGQDCDPTTRNMIKALGTDNQDFGTIVLRINDLGYLIGGATSYLGTNTSYLAFIDLCGETIWKKRYNTGNYGWFTGALVKDDFIYLSTYYGSSWSTGLIKLDFDGNVISSKKLNITGVYPRQLIETADGNLVFYGNSIAPGGLGDTDCYILKSTFDGTVLWRKQLGLSGGDQGHHVFEDSDENLVAIGYTRNYTAGIYRGLTIKFNSDGDVLWSKEYHNGANYTIMALGNEIDDFYYFTGFCNNETSGGNDGYIIKTNKDGDIIWSKLYGTSGKDLICNILQKDGTIYFSGFADSPTKGIETIVGTIDTDGNLGDYTSFGSDNDEVNYHSSLCFNTEADGFYGITSGNTEFLGNNDFIFYRFNSIVENCEPSDVELIVLDAEMVTDDFDILSIDRSWNFVTASFPAVDVSNEDGFICETIIFDTCIVNAEFEYTINGISSSDGATGGCILSEIHFTDLSIADAPVEIISWEWSFGDGDVSTEENPDHTYDSEGVYTIVLTVETDSGCTDSFTLDIEMTIGISGEVSFIEPTCFGFSDGSLTIDTTDGFGEVIFIITNEDGMVVNEDNSNTAFTLTAGWYYYTVSDDSECEIVDSVFIDEPGEITALFEFSINEVSSEDGALGGCISSIVHFTDFSTVELPEIISSWMWDFGDGVTSLDENPDHTYTSAGTYTIILTVETESGCTAFYTMDIIMLEGFSLDAIFIEPTCFGVSDGSIALNISDEIGEAIFTITNEDGITINIDNSNTVDELLSGWYYYTITDDSECGIIDSVFIDEPNEIIASFEYLVDGLSSLDGLTNTCVMNNVHFNDLSTIEAPSIIANWTWDFGDGTGSSLENPDHIYTSTGVYTILLTVETEEGCFSYYSLDIEINSIDFTVSFVQPTCHNYSDGSITINMTDGSGDYIFEITSESGIILNISNDNSAYYLPSGLYYYSVNDIVNGCIVTGSIFIDQPEAIIANFTFLPNSPSPNDIVTFTNLSIGGTTWEWNFGDGNYSSVENPTHTYTSLNNHTITLIASNGVCKDTSTVNLIMTEELIFYVPNTFTPDGNGYNNVFFPVFTSGFDIYDYHLTIFNRWGEIIFESYNAAYGWDGTYGDNGLVQDGVYIWSIEFGNAFTDKRYTHIGHITVLK